MNNRTNGLLDDDKLVVEIEENKVILATEPLVRIIDSEMVVCLRCFKNIDLETAYNVDIWYRHLHRCRATKVTHVGISDTPIAFILDECTIKCALPGCEQRIRLQDKSWRKHFRLCSRRAGVMGTVHGHILAKCSRCSSSRISLRCKPWRNHLHRFHEDLKLRPLTHAHQDITSILNSSLPLGFPVDNLFKTFRAGTNGQEKSDFSQEKIDGSAVETEKANGSTPYRSPHISWALHSAQVLGHYSSDYADGCDAESQVAGEFGNEPMPQSPIRNEYWTGGLLEAPHQSSLGLISVGHHGNAMHKAENPSYDPENQWSVPSPDSTMFSLLNNTQYETDGV